MISREEFDAEMAEFDRRQRAQRERLDALLVDQGNLTETVAHHHDRMQAFNTAMDGHDQRLNRIDTAMARLENRVEELAELSEMQGGSMAELWRDYIAHKREHSS